MDTVASCRPRYSGSWSEMITCLHKFKTILGNTVRHCLKNKTKTKQQPSLPPNLPIQTKQPNKKPKQNQKQNKQTKPHSDFLLSCGNYGMAVGKLVRWGVQAGPLLQSPEQLVSPACHCMSWEIPLQLQELGCPQDESTQLARTRPQCLSPAPPNQKQALQTTKPFQTGNNKTFNNSLEVKNTGCCEASQRGWCDVLPLCEHSMKQMCRCICMGSRKSKHWLPVFFLGQRRADFHLLIFIL